MFPFHLINNMFLIHLFGKFLLNNYYVLATILDHRETKIKIIKNVPSSYEFRLKSYSNCF